MQLHQIKRKKPNHKKKIVGRGGSRGKTSGRGTKGQNARSGGKPRPEIRDMISKLPKKRGYGKNRSRTVNTSSPVPAPVNLFVINKAFVSGDTVSPKALLEKNLIKRSKGNIPLVKILSMGSLDKKLTFSSCLVSSSAKEKIEKSGGEIK